MDAIHVVRVDESRLLEAGEGCVHAEVEPRYEEVVGVVISAEGRNVFQNSEYIFFIWQNGYLRLMII